MEKLELKHLDFQNNGLVILTRLPHWDFERVELKNCSLSFNNKEPYLIYKDVTFRLDQIKCYKRPLSDLTKEIEVNGEKFVPINKMPSNWQRYTNNEIQAHNIQALNYRTFQLLLEWHFDVFGLIEKGLAIDFNTLQNG